MDLALLVFSKYRIILGPSSRRFLGLYRDIVRVAIVLVGLVFVSHFVIQLD